MQRNQIKSFVFCRFFFFSNGDMRSICVLVDAIRHFEQVSMMQVNESKSLVCITRVPTQNKEQILRMLNFRKGSLPVTYLSMLLVSSVINIFHYNYLMERITARPNG